VTATVQDLSPPLAPHVAAGSKMDQGGRGLVIVDLLSSDWGVTNRTLTDPSRCGPALQPGTAEPRPRDHSQRQPWGDGPTPPTPPTPGLVC